jgi:hypothetical protein
MRYVKKYLAGSIPTPKEVADLSGKVVQLEKTTDETSNKVTKLLVSDVAITQSLADEVAKEALVNKVIKEALAREDAAIGGMIKDVETLKDRAQNAESSINTANNNIEGLGRSVNSAGERANSAFDMGYQNADSIKGINKTLQNWEVEQQQQNVRLDDLNSDAEQTGKNFEMLKSTGVLVAPPQPAGGINFKLPQMVGTGDIKTINGKNITGQPLIITDTDTGVVLATVTSAFENAVGTLMVGYKNNVLNIMNVGPGINITITEK